MDADNNDGLYSKDNVERLGDTTGKHQRCAYYVLDLNHDKFAVPALAAYAKACAKEYPELAKDLRAWVRYKRGKGMVPQALVWMLGAPVDAIRAALGQPREGVPDGQH